MPDHFDPAEFLSVTGDAVVAANAGGEIIYWNPAAIRLFGYTQEEALGRPLDLIIPERLRERHWSGCIRIAARCRSHLPSRSSARRMHLGSSLRRFATRPSAGRKSAS
jgi:PAS domain S-box-containing protein